MLFIFEGNRLCFSKIDGIPGAKPICENEPCNFDYISSIFARLKGNDKPFWNMHVLVFGDLLQLPPVEGIKVFKASVWRLFHPLFLEEPYDRQSDQTFFRILNKIRFGIVDEEAREALTERWQSYDPLQNVWDTTYLCSLRKEAEAINHTMLSGMPRDKAVTYI
jgi:hypothetical protein